MHNFTLGVSIRCSVFESKTSLQKHRVIFIPSGFLSSAKMSDTLTIYFHTDPSV